MRSARDLSAPRIRALATCFLVLLLLPACGKSESEVRAEIATETASLQLQIGELEAGREDDARNRRLACDRLTTNINLLNLLIDSPGRTPAQIHQLQAILDNAVQAKEALACP